MCLHLGNDNDQNLNLKNYFTERMPKSIKIIKWDHNDIKISKESKENTKEKKQEHQSKISYRKRRNPMYGPAKLQNKFNQNAQQEVSTGDSKIKNTYPIHGSVSNQLSY